MAFSGVVKSIEDTERNLHPVGALGLRSANSNQPATEALAADGTIRLVEQTNLPLDWKRQLHWTAQP